MKVDWMPDKESGFIGKLRIDVPGYLDRIEIIKGLQFSTKTEDGSVEADLEDGGLEAASKLIKVAKEKSEIVNLKHSESGMEFKTFEELECYEEGSTLIQNIGLAVIKGVSLGKKRKPQSRGK